MKHIQVSIIIVNYNTRRMTQECIESVIEHTKDVTYEIILVDNHSSDDSKQYFEADSRIRYIYSFENMGFGRANNVGLMLSKGNYVFLLNSDTLLLNNVVKQFYLNAEKNEDRLAYYGCWLRDRKQNITLSYSFIPTMNALLRKALLRYVHAFKHTSPSILQDVYNRADDEIEVGYVTGADLFFSRKIFEQYGAFDHKIFMYCEETEMQWRMKDHGIKSFVIKGPEIIHLCGGKDDNLQRDRNIRVSLMSLESKKYVLKKRYNKTQYYVFSIIYFILMFFPVLLDNRHYSLKGRLRYLWNLLLF